MALPLQPTEKKLIKGLLKFANLKRIGDARGYRQALRCFESTEFIALPVWTDPRGGANAPGGKFREVRVDAQATVRRWLDHAAKSERARREVAAEISPALATVVKSVLWVGDCRLRHKYFPHSI